jgi:hypothetical protein
VESKYGKQFAECHRVVDVGLLDPQNSYDDYSRQPKLECPKASMAYLQKPFVIYLHLWRSLSRTQATLVAVRGHSTPRDNSVELVDLKYKNLKIREGKRGRENSPWVYIANYSHVRP